jgi:hypothetical protein
LNVTDDLNRSFGRDTTPWSLQQVGVHLFLFNSTSGEYYVTSNLKTWTRGSKTILRSSKKGDSLAYLDVEKEYILTHVDGSWYTSVDAVGWKEQARIENGKGLRQVASNGQGQWLASLSTSSLNIPSDAIILQRKED